MAITEGITLFVGALDRVGSAMSYKRARREKEQALREAAIFSLMRAVNLTKAYLIDRKKDSATRDRKLERELTRAWETAGQDMHRVGGRARDVAQRCFRKGKFWTDPDSWTSDDVADADISLEKLESQLTATLDAMA